jgi:hypothetical protein
MDEDRAALILTRLFDARYNANNAMLGDVWPGEHYDDMYLMVKKLIRIGVTHMTDGELNEVTALFGIMFEGVTIPTTPHISPQSKTPVNVEVTKRDDGGIDINIKPPLVMKNGDFITINVSQPSTSDKKEINKKYDSFTHIPTKRVGDYSNGN